MKMMILPFVLALTINTQAAYVTAPSGLNVRERPDTVSKVLEVLPIGSEVETGAGGISGSMWTAYGEGYVCSEWLSEENPLEYMGEWRVTAYAYTGSPCANGEFPETEYTIAHNTLPFGTQVYIEGVGIRTVEDRGQKWLGSEWCDLYLENTDECIQWGDQTRKVWLVK